MSKINKSISVLIPAYNEEKNIAGAINSALKILKKNFRDYEIIVFDDKSKDNTGKIADKISKKNKRIIVVHNAKNMGLGYNYMAAVKIASKEYFTWFPGDNENDESSFEKTLQQIGKADIIIPYTANQKVRTFNRRFISKLFVWLMNLLFGLNLRYYNGLVVYGTADLKKIEITTFGFAYSAEILIKMLRQGKNFIEYPVKIKPTKKTSAFKIKNILSVIKTIAGLLYEVHCKNKARYSKKSTRIL